MEDSLLSSPVLQNHKPGQNWDTPTRLKVRLLRKQGDSYGVIVKKTGLRRPTIQKIVKSGSSRRTRKGKVYKPKLIETREIERIIKWVSASWDNRRASYARIKVELKINTSTTTIRKTLKIYGYCRCVACRRPFISKKQVRKRLAFAMKYRW
jgi:hypothetical protein